MKNVRTSLNCLKRRFFFSWYLTLKEYYQSINKLR